MSTDRRSFLRGLLAAGVAAPAIVHDIMRVKTMLWTPRTNLFVGTTIYDGDAEIGSAANPWRTIQQAIDYVTKEIDFREYPAVTVNVGEGSFEGFSIPDVGYPAFINVRGAGEKVTMVEPNPITGRHFDFMARHSTLDLGGVTLDNKPGLAKPGLALARDATLIRSVENGVWTIEGKKR